MVDVTSGTPLKLPTALLLLLILRSLNMQELGIKGIQYMGCYKFTNKIKDEGKRKRKEQLRTGNV